MWNGKEHRKKTTDREYSGKERRARVETNYRESAQVYQLERAVRVVFLPDFNVWQVHKMDYPGWKQLRFEIIGYRNSQIAFDFAMLYIKLLKYGLDKEELARMAVFGYDIREDKK